MSPAAAGHGGPGGATHDADGAAAADADADAGDALAVLDRVVDMLRDEALAVPEVIFPGAVFVALTDALDLLHTDPTAGEPELNALHDGLTQLAALLASCSTSWAETAPILAEAHRALGRLAVPSRAASPRPGFF